MMKKSRVLSKNSNMPETSRHLGFECMVDPGNEFAITRDAML